MKDALALTHETSTNSVISLSWRDKRYQRFYEIIDRLVSELQEHVWRETNKRKRRLTGNDLDKLHYSVECLVRDCIAVVLSRKRKGKASIRKGQYYYSANRPDMMLAYRIHIKRAFEGMVELEYLEVSSLGHNDRKGRKDGTSTGRLTRYVAASNLLNLFTEKELKELPVIVPQYSDPELIRVRVKEKDNNGVKRNRSVPFKETNQTTLMRDNLYIINKALSKHWYDLEIPDEELSSLQRRLADDPKNERVIRMDQRSLYRVFNDPDLKTGGRFYGGWWQNIPKEYRKRLAINGKQMVELDYSNQHPTILYAWEGSKRPADCYADVIKLDHFPKGFTKSDLRDMIKASFNAMLNSKKVLKQPPTGVQPSKFGLKWAQVSEAIIAFHQPIKHHFYTGVGLRLQRLDSDIAEKVMLHFAQSYIAILPLHDSFLMHDGHESSLKKVMRDAFENVTSEVPKIDNKTRKAVPNLNIRVADDDFGPNTTLDIDELLIELDVGYEHRLSAFRSIKERSGPIS